MRVTDWESEFKPFNKDESKIKARVKAYFSSSAGSQQSGSSDMSSNEGGQSQTMRRSYYEHTQTVSPMEIFRLLAELGMDPEDKGDVIQTRFCPFCMKPHNYDRTNMYTFGIRKSDCLWNCFRCNESGNWTQFEKRIAERGHNQTIHKPARPEKV